MKPIRFIRVASLFAATALLVPSIGCGKPANEVIQPGELTPEQQAEMDKLGDELKASKGGGGKKL